jgi:hypothetical protein
MNLILSLILVVGAALQVFAQGTEFDEYRVKAAFLFSFAKFVVWPLDAFTDSGQPIGICVLGQNPFGSVLEETVRGKVVENRTFVVREISNAQEASKCHIVFVSASEKKRSPAWLEELKNQKVLTVSETDGVNSNGGVIGLSLKDGRVRIEIDPAAAARAKLRISSKLLSLADIRTQ